MTMVNKERCRVDFKMGSNHLALANNKKKHKREGGRIRCAEFETVNFLDYNSPNP